MYGPLYQDAPQGELVELLGEYDRHVQTFFEEWVAEGRRAPLSVEEFYEQEFSPREAE